jgi:DNA invertase Pin-like site-specific DNA recombinase
LETAGIPNKMKTIAYHRTSTAEQHLDRGITEITKYCEEHDVELYKGKVYTDQHTGKDFNRPRYQILKEELLESGDALIVTELDRLGRNKKATLNELRYYQDHDIRVMVLELPTTLLPILEMENSMAKMMLETINNMMIELYASMAQAELEKKQKRQREGIDAKKARGEWGDYGRPRIMAMKDFAERYKAVLDGKKRPFELMRELGMTKATFYRYKGMLRNEG